jgi:hypothetical protein
MSPEDHNKLLGWGHIAYASFHSLLGLFMGFMFGAFALAGIANPHTPDSFPAAFFMAFAVFFSLFYLAMAMPSFIAGVGLLKRKSWAKIWSTIAGVMSAMSFPLGTAVCVYTFWFMFGEQGKALYDQPKAQWPPAGLYGAPAASEWDFREARTREYQYVPPDGPPNWRGDN